jgi:hypothetical protein
MVSFIPMAALNHNYAKSWTGDPLNQSKAAVANPFAGMFGNSLMLGFSAFQPPILASPSRVNDFAANHLLPHPFKIWLVERFPRFELRMGEIPMEESAGLGLGLISCLALWLLFGKRSSFATSTLLRQPWFLLGTAGLFSLLFFMAKMGSESTARLLLPYYPFLLLLPLGFWSLPRQTARKLVPFFTLLCSPILVALILSPARPLFPVQKLLTLMGDRPRFARVREVYQTYKHRDNCWDPILTSLPPDIKTLGVFTHGDDLEAPLWKPFGLRKIVCAGEKDITMSRLPYAEAWLARRRVAEFLKSNHEWQLHWKEAGSYGITQRASIGSEEWVLFLVR